MGRTGKFHVNIARMEKMRAQDNGLFCKRFLEFLKISIDIAVRIQINIAVLFRKALHQVLEESSFYGRGRLDNGMLEDKAVEVYLPHVF